MKKNTTIVSGLALVLTLTNSPSAHAQFDVSALVAGLSNSVGSSLTSAFTTATKAAGSFVATHPGLVKGAVGLAATGAKKAVQMGATAAKTELHKATTAATTAAKNKVHQALPGHSRPQQQQPVR